MLLGSCKRTRSAAQGANDSHSHSLTHRGMDPLTGTSLPWGCSTVSAPKLRLAPLGAMRPLQMRGFPERGTPSCTTRHIASVPCRAQVTGPPQPMLPQWAGSAPQRRGCLPGNAARDRAWNCLCARQGWLSHKGPGRTPGRGLSQVLEPTEEPARPTKMLLSSKRATW